MDAIFNSFTSVLLLLCQNLYLGKKVAAWVSSQWIDPSGKELWSLTKIQSGPEAAYSPQLCTRQEAAYGLKAMHSGSSEVYPEELGITGYGFPCQGISRLAPYWSLWEPVKPRGAQVSHSLVFWAAAAGRQQTSAVVSCRILGEIVTVPTESSFVN